MTMLNRAGTAGPKGAPAQAWGCLARAASNRRAVAEATALYRGTWGRGNALQQKLH